MSDLTLNGAPVAAATLRLPRAGAWVAEVTVLTDAAPTGALTLAAAGGPTWAGALVRGALSGRTWRGLLVGGAGGLSRRLDPRAYQGATFADVVGDALREAGETLAPDAADLTAVVRWWHRHAETTGQVLARVATAAGYGWRVRADGRVWLGVDAWGDAAGDPDAIDVTDRDPTAGRYTLRGDTLGLAPGTTLLLPDDAGALTGVRLAEVRHDVDATRVTTTVWEAA